MAGYKGNDRLSIHAEANPRPDEEEPARWKAVGSSTTDRSVTPPETVADFGARLRRVRRQVVDLRRYHRDQPEVDLPIAVDLVRLLASAAIPVACARRPIEACSDQIAEAILGDAIARAELQSAWDAAAAEGRRE